MAGARLEHCAADFESSLSITHNSSQHCIARRYWLYYHRGLREHLVVLYCVQQFKSHGGHRYVSLKDQPNGDGWWLGTVTFWRMRLYKDAIYGWIYWISAHTIAEISHPT